MHRARLLSSLGFAFGVGLLASACGAFEVKTSATSTTAPTDDTTPSQGQAPPVSVPVSADPETPPDWVNAAVHFDPLVEVPGAIALATRSGTLNFYIATKDGRVVVAERTVSPTQLIERINLSNRAVLDISDSVSDGPEQGLLNLTFSTDGRQLFVYYTDLAGDVVIDRYDMGNAGRADTSSRLEVLRIPQPAPNHNGGSMAIGVDGFLYLGIGDGGGAGDPQGHGQDRHSLLGSILRIDPDGATEERSYGVPPGNPHIDGVDGAAELWLTGVRNPWRFSFDPANGDLWVADVGQDQYEEITYLPQSRGSGLGANLGWNAVEGLTPYDGAAIPEDHTAPLWVYEHTDGRCSITGGHVMRNPLMPHFDGVYIFGDYCTGEVWGLELSDDGPIVRPLNGASAEPGQLVSFAQDQSGSLFAIEQSGRISRLAPDTGEE